MRFAIITQEILLRRKELVVKNKKGVTINKNASETLFLYVVILLHSWRNGVCDRTIPEICRAYGLDRQNSYRRLKILRDKGWIEDTKKHIRPILIYRADDARDVEKEFSTIGEKTVIITPFEDEKSVIITPQNCNDYTFEDEKSVIITPEIAATSSSDNGYSQPNSFKTNINNTLKPPTTGGRSDGGNIPETKIENKSEFSRSECLQWANKRKANGENIENPLALAQWAYRTGERDDYIYILLYPDGRDEHGRKRPRRQSAERREQILKDLRSFSPDEFAVIEESWRETYTADDWAWLIENLNKKGDNR